MLVSWTSYNVGLMMLVALWHKLILMQLAGFAASVEWLGMMIEDITLTVIIIVLLVIGSYACSRAIAIAWFRTKLEYVRKILREGPHHGEG